MGCISSKRINKSEFSETQRERGSSRSSRRFIASSHRDEVVVLESDAIPKIDGSRARLISKGQGHVGTPPKSLDHDEKKMVQFAERARRLAGQRRRTEFEPRLRALSMKDEEETRIRITSVPNGVEAEQLAAGWPSWLTAVAGEALKGWLPRRADSFEKLDKIGQGTYSNVYRARDLENGKTVALKKVRFVNMDPESVRFMAREIHILRRLDHPNIVKLEGLVTSRMCSSLYLVFEYMEHDLAGLAATPSIKFTEPQVKCYMKQLLLGLDHCHSRGVLHRDIKGSNLLIDNNGILRIADFGLASLFNPNQKQPLTSRVVTLWYRPPELLLGATDYGVAVDLWSAGCILAELLAGKPIMPGRTEVEQLHKIFKLCGSPSEEYWRKSRLPHATIFKPQHPYQRCFDEIYRDFPHPALSLLNSLLAIEPEARGTAASALENEFFSSKPLPCDPSSLPKYPPSKELDAKLRDEEARRQRAEAIKGRGSQSGRCNPRESKAVPMPDANAEMQVSLQKRNVLANPKSISEKYSSQEEGASGFPIEPPKGAAANSIACHGPSLHPGVVVSSWDKKAQITGPRMVHGRLSSSMRASNGLHSRTQRSYVADMGGGDLSNLSGPVAARSSANSRYGHFNVPEHSEKLLERPSSSHKKDERTGGKETTTGQGYGARRSRLHYSGLLVPQGGNIDEMLKEHERQILQAVRRSRVDKTKDRKTNGERGQFESLIFPSVNGV